MLYISEYLETNRDQYVGLLRMLNGPETWIAWIEFFLLAVTKQAQDNLIKARGILDLYQKMKDKFLELTHSQYAIPLLDHLFFKPIITSAELMRSKGMPSKPMVMNLIKILKNQGILKVLREGSGRRPQILVLSDLVNISEGKGVI
jgi:Fic family protein